MYYEQLGVFYLGREVSGNVNADAATPLLYDSSDLTTHAVIVGMTGSGKTGLGIDLIEEAALDGVPVLAIDPKGDLTNLALTFPELRPADFEPWLDPREAETAGIDLSTYASQVASRWREGLKAWDQDGERIARLRDAADVTIYTPGSTAGQPVSILGSFAAPAAAVRAEPDLLGDRLSSTATGLLALLGEDADPLGREHLLITTILLHFWEQGRDLDIAAMISAVQRPPFDEIGVLGLETVFPAKDRTRLAIALNTLLAAPGFASWLTGTPLDLQSLLYSDSGKPRIAVMSLNHLSEAERMFFLTLMLGEVVTWTRSQSGTSSLRALVYIDELFGLLPPVAEPPTKKPLLTMLKQARAFGVGLALATQNPVDLDYKALSNAGTWMIGRLQTERDVDRLVDGLGSSDGGTDVADLAKSIAGLAKRHFVLHNVHEPAPVIFETRWAMSYLAGPLTREQIRQLRQDAPENPMDRAKIDSAAAPGASADRAVAASESRTQDARLKPVAPVLPATIPQAFVHGTGTSTGGGLESQGAYLPAVLAIADVHFSSKTHAVEHSTQVARLAATAAGSSAADWRGGDSSALTLEELSSHPEPDVLYTDFPANNVATSAAKGWTDDFHRWLRTDGALQLWRSAEYKLTSRPGESERDFRVRCAQAAREARDEQREALRARYQSKLGVIERRVLREEQAVGREQQQLQHRAVDTVGSLVGAIFGSGRRGAALSSALRKASSGSKDLGDVQRARERLAAAETELAELTAELDERLAELDALVVQGDRLALTTVTIKPTKRDVAVRFLGVVWIEHHRHGDDWVPVTAVLQPAVA